MVLLWAKRLHLGRVTNLCGVLSCLGHKGTHVSWTVTHVRRSGCRQTLCWCLLQRRHLWRSWAVPPGLTCLFTTRKHPREAKGSFSDWDWKMPPPSGWAMEGTPSWVNSLSPEAGIWEGWAMTGQWLVYWAKSQFPVTFIEWGSRRSSLALPLWLLSSFCWSWAQIIWIYYRARE